MRQSVLSLWTIAVVFVLGLILIMGADVARSAPSAVDLPVDGNLVFSAAGESARDVRTGDNDGGLRFFSGTTLTNPPQGAAIQFFGNDRSVFNGQAYIDSGAHNNAALIFRTAGTSQALSERLRITSDGNVGIGITTPQSKLQVWGGYFQMAYLSPGALPPASDCDSALDVGRVILQIGPASAGGATLWVCGSTTEPPNAMSPVWVAK